MLLEDGKLYEFRKFVGSGCRECSTVYQKLQKLVVRGYLGEREGIQGTPLVKEKNM